MLKLVYAIQPVLQNTPHIMIYFIKVTNFYNLKTKEECVDILKNLLNNEENLINYTKKFSDKTRNCYEDSKSFKKVFNF